MQRKLIIEPLYIWRHNQCFTSLYYFIFCQLNWRRFALNEWIQIFRVFMCVDFLKLIMLFTIQVRPNVWLFYLHIAIIF